MKTVRAFAITVILAGAAFLSGTGCQKENAPLESAKIKSAEQTSFKEVTSKLDPGGNLYLYLSTEQWLKNLSDGVEKVRQATESLQNPQEKQEQINNAFNVVTRLLKDSGLEDVSGVG